ncbi:MAG: hypothetical protein KI790_12750 [Cyclobacteriaceae bacterium]|nr:hypothetical protein [Cyclobacteriaceae bacterium HetDA_MAG_MS6]
MNDQMLRRALHANWIFSTISGLLMIFDEPILQDLAGVSYPFAGLGYQLLFFAAIVAFAAFRKAISKAHVWVIIVLDASWELMCITLLFVPTGMTTTGKVIMMVSAAIVGTLAYFQLIGLTRATSKKLAV